MTESPTLSADAPPPGATERARCPILWVEDDPVLSDWIAQSLQDEGWPLLIAHDRLQALQTLERALPKGQACIALLDMGLPPRPSRPDEGLLLLSQLLTQWPLLHAIVLTGQHEQSVAQQAVHAGAFDFLHKPVTQAQLRQALERAAWFALRQQELLAQGRLHLSVPAQLSDGVREASDQVAEQLIRHVLNCNGFNVAAAARTLGLEREQLYYHMKKFGIQRTAQADAQTGPTA